MNFSPVALNEITHVITKGTTPTTMGRPFTEEGVNFIKAEALNGDTNLLPAGIAHIDEETHTMLRRSILHENDVLVTIAGAQVGKCGFVRPENLPANTNQAVGIVRANIAKAAPRFVYYFFKQPKTFTICQTIGSAQAAQPNVNLTVLGNFTIPLPKLDIQHRIASILSAYDDLIENNRRRMGLLEEAARQLYREWFVRLRFPGHERVKIKDGVPEGWERKTLGDFYNTASGGTPSRTKPEYFNGEIPWVKTQELPNGFISETQEYITEEALIKSSAKLFPERTVLVALYGATIGELGMLAMPAATNQACCALFPKDSRSHYTHAFLFLRENKENLVSLAAGAAQNNISQQIIRVYTMVMPSKTLMDSFVDTLVPVFDQWLNLLRQNQKLRAARDLLLPKLMNGEIEPYAVGA